MTQTGTAFIEPFGDITSMFRTDFAMTSLLAMGQWPKDWGAFLGGLGYYSSENDFSETLSADCCGEVTNEGSIRDDGLAATLGIEWRFGRFGTRYGLRLEYEIWDIDAADASAVSLSLSYGF